MKPFRPGLQISARDAVVLVVGGATAAFVARTDWWLGLVVGFVVGHFFLFCNVFRIARRLELAWAALFLALAVGTAALGVPGPLPTIVTCLVATLLVIIRDMRTPSYHGIAWRQLNPKLLLWWEAQGQEER